MNTIIINRTWSIVICVAVTTKVGWYTYAFPYDFDNVDSTIQELMYQTLAAKYIGSIAYVSDVKKLVVHFGKIHIYMDLMKYQ